MKKKFRIATLGCRTNQYESQAYRDQLEALGYEEAGHGEKADLCIVNTCTVTQSADASSRHQIRQLIRENEGTKMVVTGCLTENAPDLIEQVDGISLIAPNKSKEDLIAHLFPDEEVPEFKIHNFEAHTRAFVKVQDGCNSFCTYCIIPYVRGRSRSRPLEVIVKEVEGLVAAGYKEVVITGINVGDYDDRGRKLSSLIRAVDRVEGLKRLRLSSIDPDEVDDALLGAIMEGKNTCNSMHIVLQSGSNVVLKRMNRKYTKQIFFQTLERLQKADPHFTCTTDVIVGFPGESESDFADTLEVVRDVQFAKVHMFPYSARKKTRAALYLDQIRDEVKAERKSRLLRLAEEVAYSLRNSYVGQTVEVLTENRSGGHTTNFLPVKVEAKQNELVHVYIEKNTPEGLEGRIVDHNRS
ncbi:MAG: tRNA (N(6)-L-threonylcarbamoyladenosine(37)-C(2))-methylthiotransferase MtaB [Chlamydiales bacterium]